MSNLPNMFYNSNNFRYNHLSICEDLTEEELLNIENNPDNQSWLYISNCKRLSKDFIYKYYDKLIIQCLLQNPYLLPEIKELCKTFV